MSVDGGVGEGVGVGVGFGWSISAMTMEEIDIGFSKFRLDPLPKAKTLELLS